MAYYFLKGFLIGLCIAIPLGPIGVLCINRVLQRGFLFGLVTGLGAATADGVYGIIAGFSLTYISDFLLHERNWINAIGGLFLVYLGISTYSTRPVTKSAVITNNIGLFGSFSSTFLLTIANPMTILFFAAVFSGLGLSTASRTPIQASILVIGVVLGSLCWWFVLSTYVGYLSRRMIPQTFINWTNQISGLILILFGVIALLTLMYSFI